MKERPKAHKDENCWCGHAHPPESQCRWRSLIRGKVRSCKLPRRRPYEFYGYCATHVVESLRADSTMDLSATFVADAIGIDPKTLIALCETGRVPHRRTDQGKRRRFVLAARTAKGLAAAVSRGVDLLELDPEALDELFQSATQRIA